MVKLSDLSATEKLVLRLIEDEPNTKHIGGYLRAANYLGSLGLAIYTGGLRWELTREGKELYKERKLFFEHPEEHAVKELLI